MTAILLGFNVASIDLSSAFSPVSFPLPVGEVYQHLQALSRHRHNLTKQQARLKVQIRRLMHQAMPGYADLWEDDKLYHRSIAMPIALAFPSAGSPPIVPANLRLARTSPRTGYRHR